MADLRMPGVNKVLIDGRLTRDPELKETNSGMPIAKFAIANTQYYKKQESVTFVDVTVFGRSAEFAAELQKGDAVFVEARLSLSEWTAKDGTRRQRHELKADRVSPLQWRDKGKESDAPQHAESSTEPWGGTQAPDDDIPF